MKYDNEEDSLEFINRLLERLHHAGHDHQCSQNIHLVYVASGAQHVETQYISLSPNPMGEKPLPDPPQKGREKPAEDSFNDDTPLSALFREGYHEKLKVTIDSWRRYLSDDEAGKDALELSHFEFDKDRIYANRVYRDLCDLDAQGGLRVSLSQLARYLASHSNLSRSYASLYQQLKYYRNEWQ